MQALKSDAQIEPARPDMMFRVVLYGPYQEKGKLGRLLQGSPIDASST